MPPRSKSLKGGRAAKPPPQERVVERLIDPALLEKQNKKKTPRLEAIPEDPTARQQQEEDVSEPEVVEEPRVEPSASQKTKKQAEREAARARLTPAQRNEIIDAFRDPRHGLSVDRTYEALGKRFTMRTIKAVLRDLPEYQLTRRPKKPRQYFPIRTGQERSFQGDLIFFPVKARGRHIGLINLIETTTRYAFSYPIRSKSAQEMVRVLKEWIEDAKPNALSTDSGKEFLSKPVQDLLKKHNIKHYATAEPGDHNRMGLIERFNRTLKAKISLVNQITKRHNFAEHLSQIIENYNTTVHSSTKLSPVEMEGSPIRRFLERSRTWRRMKKILSDLEPGDWVRILLPKRQFEKEGRRWSTTVHRIVSRDGVKYVLDNGQKKAVYQLLEVPPPSQSEEAKREEKRREDMERTEKRVQKRKRVARTLAKEGVDPKLITRGNRRGRRR